MIDDSRSMCIGIHFVAFLSRCARLRCAKKFLDDGSLHIRAFNIENELRAFKRKRFSQKDAIIAIIGFDNLSLR